MLVAVALGVAYLALRATVLAPVDTHGASVHKLVVHSKAVSPGPEGRRRRP